MWKSLVRGRGSITCEHLELTDPRAFRKSCSIWLELGEQTE